MSFKSLPAACRLGRLAMLALLVAAAAAAAVLFFFDALPAPAAVLASLTLLLAALPLLLAWTAVRRRTDAVDGAASEADDGEIVRKDDAEPAGSAVLLSVLASKLQLLCGSMRDLSRGAASGEAAAAEAAQQEAEAAAAAVAAAPPAGDHAAADPPTAEEPRGPQRAAEPAAAESGRVDAAVKEMETIAATVDRAALQIKHLLNELHRVSSIAAVIGEVAIQAELLALNAAMEAARSGQRGRTLAAGAMSARELTRRAGATTARIEQTIHAIQLEASGAESAIAQVGRQVRRGVELVQGSIDGSREADAAPPSGEAGSASIAEQMERIAQIVEGSSASMRSAAAATAELERLAQSLSETLSAFRA